MGLNPFWKEDFLLTVQAFHHDAQIIQSAPFFIIQLSTSLSVHLIALDYQLMSSDLLQLQDQYKESNHQLIQLWEDIWIAKRQQVISRIRSLIGLNKGIHGRKAKILALTQKQSSTFLDLYHLQGFVKAKFYFGLIVAEEIVAVASFSETRPMKSRGDQYQSAELVRFATKDGFTVVGGLSKLIKHFSNEVKMDDLMTYADRDWSVGKGYEKLGFRFSTATEPAGLYLHVETLVRYFPHRLPKTIISKFESQKTLNLDDFLAMNGFVKLFNTGNLKYHLYF